MKKVYNLLRHFALCAGILGMAMLPSQLEAQCSISSVTATAALCSGANSNSYNLSGQVSFTNAPGSGSLVISVQGGHSAVINAPFTSPVSYNIQKLIADGVNRTVTAYFTATPSCTGSTTVAAPSPVGSTIKFPLGTNSDNYYDGTPWKYTIANNMHHPNDGASGSSRDLEAFDVDWYSTNQDLMNWATFCIEKAQPFPYPNLFTVISLETANNATAGQSSTHSKNIPAGGIGKVRAGMLRYLFDNYYLNTNLANSSWTNTNVGAFAAAVAEVTHENYSSNNSFSLKISSTNGYYYVPTSGNVNDNAAINLAETWLQTINALNWTDEQWMAYQPTTWHVVALARSDYQDVVTAVPIACAFSCTTPTHNAPTTVMGTCTGGTPNNNATITVTGIANADRIGISAGATYSGTPAYAAATNISGAMHTFTGLMHNTQYTIRLFNGADNCFTDVTITSASITCCTNPTHNAPTTAAGTCTGGTPNNNATITVTGIANADRIGISTGATYSGTPAYAAATNIAGAMHTFTGLMHNTQYTIRLFNGADNCFTDVTISSASITCCVNPTHNAPTTAQGTCTGSTPNNNATITVTGIANADRIGISTGATYSGTPAYAAATNIAGAMHTFTGLMHNTQYTIRLFNGADNCFTDVTITTASIACCTVTINSSTPTACVPATNTYSLTVNVSWTNASGTTLTVTSNAPGATPQTITTTAGSSGTQSVTFTGLTANATMYNVTAQFGAGCTATTTNAYTAPPSCTGCPTGDCGSTTVTRN